MVVVYQEKGRYELPKGLAEKLDSLEPLSEELRKARDDLRKRVSDAVLFKISMPKVLAVCELLS